MKLYPLSISRLHFLECGQFVTRFVSDFEATGENPTTDARFNKLFESLQNQLPTYNEAQMQVKAQTETQQLQELDEVRDKKVAALRFALKAFRYTDDTAKKQAYQQLSLLLNTYKGVEKLNFEAETAGLDKLLADLKNDTYSPAVATLGIAEHIQNLKTAATNFKNLFNTRSDATTLQVVYDTKKLRADLLETYRKMASYIESVASVDDSDFYRQTMQALNNGREYFAGIISRRG